MRQPRPADVVALLIVALFLALGIFALIQHKGLDDAKTRDTANAQTIAKLAGDVESANAQLRALAACINDEAPSSRCRALATQAQRAQVTIVREPGGSTTVIVPRDTSAPSRTNAPRATPQPTPRPKPKPSPKPTKTPTCVQGHCVPALPF